MQKVLQVGRKHKYEVTATVKCFFFLYCQGILMTHYVRGDQFEAQLGCCFFYVIHTWLNVSLETMQLKVRPLQEKFSPVRRTYRKQPWDSNPQPSCCEATVLANHSAVTSRRPNSEMFFQRHSIAPGSTCHQPRRHPAAAPSRHHIISPAGATATGSAQGVMCGLQEKRAHQYHGVK